jgi:hypothetical protein
MRLQPKPSEGHDEDGAAPAAEAAKGGAVGVAELPCAYGMLAACVALMTAFAQPAPDARVDAACQRRLMARKLVSHFFFLGAHPGLPPAFRQVMSNAHAMWMQVAASLDSPPAAAAPVGRASAPPGTLH